MSSLGSFERIQGFLNEIERQPIKHLDQGISEASGSRNIEMVSQNTSNIVAASDNTVITMTNASLGLTLDTATPLLNNVNISLRRSSITLIIGPVGSGKTTLLKGLLGVTPIGNPPEQSFREAAYCAQTPWLTNTNIRHNIVAYNEFDESWYREVLQASALDNDLEQLQSGDQTIVGSKGLSLSGGQQQRVVSCSILPPALLTSSFGLLNRYSH